jgi:hypothetical protein
MQPAATEIERKWPVGDRIAPAPTLFRASRTVKETLAAASRTAAPIPAAPRPTTTTSRSSVLPPGSMRAPFEVIRRAEFRHQHGRTECAHALRLSHHFASWLGLTPKSHSSGGKERLGRISKMGNATLRSLLIVGATSVVRHTRNNASAPKWLSDLLKRRPYKVVAVALANKMARIVPSLFESFTRRIRAKRRKTIGSLWVQPLGERARRTRGLTAGSMMRLHCKMPLPNEKLRIWRRARKATSQSKLRTPAHMINGLERNAGRSTHRFVLAFRH